MRAQYRTPIFVVLPFLLLIIGAGPQAPKAQKPKAVDFQFGFLKSGTVIGEEPPQNWTDLILKSSSKLAGGDLGALPASAQRTATLFKPFVVANVTRSETAGPKYRLTRVGLGLCMSYEGKDRVVSSKALGPAGDTLGFIERQVLAKAEEEQQKAQIIARTPTFALMATPARLKTGKGQKPVYLLYAMLVNPETGKLHNIVWSVDNTQGPRPPIDTMIMLNPNLTFQTGLDVQAGKILGAIPVSWEFAMQSLPPGRKFQISPELQTLSADLRKIQSDPSGFEKKIRAVLNGAITTPGVQATRDSSSPH